MQHLYEPLFRCISLFIFARQGIPNTITKQQRRRILFLFLYFFQKNLSSIISPTKSSVQLSWLNFKHRRKKLVRNIYLEGRGKDEEENKDRESIHVYIRAIDGTSSVSITVRGKYNH